MALSIRLTEQLSSLTLGVVGDGTGLADEVAALVSTIGEAVSGYAGLRLTLVHTGHPVQLTALLPALADQDVVTSLRLSLPALSDAFEEGGRLVVWSTVAGSLVDLAADLDYVFAAVGGSSRSRSSAVELDQDLPLPRTASGLVGLDELATIHRATGLLIARGHDPASVRETLRVGADRDGTTTWAWAAGLLRQH